MKPSGNIAEDNVALDAHGRRVSDAIRDSAEEQFVQHEMEASERPLEVSVRRFNMSIWDMVRLLVKFSIASTIVMLPTLILWCLILFWVIKRP